MGSARFSIVTDIHHGPVSQTKKGDDALRLLDGYLAHVGATNPDFVLDLGDRISDVDPQTDRRLLAEVAQRFVGLGADRAHLLGNHDVHHLTRAENAAALGVSMDSRVVDLGFCRLVIWQPDVRIDRDIGFPDATPSLPWLVEALEASEKPAIVLSHVPLSGHSQIGNYYFERNADLSTFAEHAAVRQAAEAAGTVALWLSGHVHWNTVTTVGGIPHVTVQSLTESFTTPEVACGAFADLDLRDEEFTLTVHGQDPFHVRLPFRPSGRRRWVAPHGRFPRGQRHPGEAADA